MLVSKDIFRLQNFFSKQFYSIDLLFQKEFYKYSKLLLKLVRTHFLTKIDAYLLAKV